MELNRVAIIGGGPGGLMTAHLLKKNVKTPLEITLFESTERLGGKLKTLQFKAAPVRYEAGAAELYDYSRIGPDPLRELVAEFALPTHPLEGRTVVMDDEPLTTDDEIRRKLGESGYAALKEFGDRARSLIAPPEYYESDWQEDNKDPLGQQRFSELLATLKHETARRYVCAAIHSDVATEPHHTNATYGLQNFLMNEPGYMQLYTIDGGNERLVRELAKRMSARPLLGHRVVRVEPTPAGTYRVIAKRKEDKPYVGEFDWVVAALPNNWLASVEWGEPDLARAMQEHHAYYDHPAHYTRVSVLFERPFWRDRISEGYFMLDTFDGCCVYDESSRTDGSTHGVLGWLLAGEAALRMSNFDDAALIDSVLESLPSCIRRGREFFREGHVTRWVGAINGLPGGFPLRDPDSRHRPAPEAHPRVFVVGDYLFDATLNGVLDSATTVVEWIADEF